MKAEYYPHLDKTDLFELGYIARQSTHTTGLAVDLAFEGLDFGTPFDLFDEKSNTADPRVTGAARKSRPARGSDGEARIRKFAERMVALHLQRRQRSGSGGFRGGVTSNASTADGGFAPIADVQHVVRSTAASGHSSKHVPRDAARRIRSPRHCHSTDRNGGAETGDHTGVAIIHNLRAQFESRRQTVQ